MRDCLVDDRPGTLCHGWCTWFRGASAPPRLQAPRRSRGVPGTLCVRGVPGTRLEANVSPQALIPRCIQFVRPRRPWGEI